MTCPCDQPKSNCSSLNPKNIIQIDNECPVLFHQVVRPATLGDDVDTPPEELDYKNVLLVYQANGHAYLYSSDGIPTFISYLPTNTDVDELERALEELQADLANEALERHDADSELAAKTASNAIAIEQNAAAIETNVGRIADEAQTRSEADANLQSQLNNLADSTETQLDSLDSTVQSMQDVVVQKDTAISTDASTVTITKTRGELTGDNTETAMPLPVADSTQAGVMNPATYNAVQENSENIDSILGGAVVVDDLTPVPSQTELTESWKTATGKDVLINRASIYDTENKLVWYYYENANEWKSMPAGDAAVSVSIATNDTPGIVRSSDAPGQITVEPDGSMSQNGYDGIQHDIENLSQLVAGIEVPKTDTYIATARSSSDIISGYIQDSINKGVKIELKVMDTSTGTATRSGRTLKEATPTTWGVMSPSDKSKLDNLPAITEIGENLELTDEGVLNASGGSEYVLPTKIVGAAPATSVDKPIQITTRNNALNLEYGMRNTATGTLAQGWAFPLPEATDNVNGLMSAADKSKLDSLLEIKSLNGSLELDENGQLSVVGGGGSDVNLPQYVFGYNTTAQSPAFLTRSNGIVLALPTFDSATGEYSVLYSLNQIPTVTTTSSGVMSVADKTKLDSITPLTEMEQTRVSNLPPAVVTGFEDTTYGTDTITMHLDTKDLATGGVSVQELELDGAVANTAEAGGHAGLMTAFQATQLAALAEAGVEGTMTTEEFNAAWEAA